MNFVKSWEEFKAILLQHEIDLGTKYVYAYGPKSVTEEKCIKITEGMRLHWQDGIPYFHFGTRTYFCHQGKDINTYQKQKYAKQRDKEACSKNGFVKRYKKVQSSKKVDCPAKIHVTRVFRMAEYKISGSVTNKCKDRISSKIKEKIRKGEDVAGNEGYMFNLPGLEEHHFHLMEKLPAVTKHIDERVRNYISDLVWQGKRSATLISELLEVFVSTELLETDRSQQSLYLNIQTIQSVINETKSKIRATKIDLENTEDLVNSWDISDWNVYFRPCATKNLSNYVQSCTLNDDDEEEEENMYIQWKPMHVTNNHLLFVYQSHQMKLLYQRYGKNSILLDAAYRSCKYTIPLYFVIVETNVDYQVVGVIVTQFETSDALSEALTIFKDWSPNIIPKYAMADLVAEEISSLETVFPTTKVFISSFHRKMAWGRWLSRAENASVLPKDGALSHLRNIANAKTETEVIAAVNSMKLWDLYDATELKHYFESTWEKEIKRWTLAFKPNDMLLDTNNSVERLSEELQYQLLHEYKGCVLSEVIKYLVIHFLIEKYTTYVLKNLQIFSRYQKYDKELPECMRSRPNWFIDHLQVRWSSISVSSAKKVSVIEVNKFKVPDGGKKGTGYVTVTFDKENSCCSCTCADYRMKRLVCKHVILVGIKYPDWSLDKIHSWLFANPVYMCDETVINMCYNEGSREDITSHSSPTEIDTGSNTGLQLNEEKSSHRQLIDDCNASISAIQSGMWFLDENKLTELSGVLRGVFQLIFSVVTPSHDSDLSCADNKNGSSSHDENNEISVTTTRTSASSRVSTFESTNVSRQRCSENSEELSRPCTKKRKCH